MFDRNSAIGRILRGDSDVIWYEQEALDQIFLAKGVEFPAKVYVNGIRHWFTEYDAALAELYNLPQKNRDALYRAIKNAVLLSIIEVYPQYAAEARRQCCFGASEPVTVPGPSTISNSRAASVLSPIQQTALRLREAGTSFNDIGSKLCMKKAQVHSMFQQISVSAHS